MELAETIATEVSGAIDHANVHHSAQKRSQRIVALAQMSQSITQGNVSPRDSPADRHDDGRNDGIENLLSDAAR